MYVCVSSAYLYQYKPVDQNFLLIRAMEPSHFIFFSTLTLIFFFLKKGHCSVSVHLGIHAKAL